MLIRYHTDLMKLKLNLRIGPNSTVNKTFHGYKINAFTLSKNIVSAVRKKQPLSYRKPIGLAVLKMKNKSREHSSIPSLPGSVTEF